MSAVVPLMVTHRTLASLRTSERALQKVVASDTVVVSPTANSVTFIVARDLELE
jgi:hypothetical protein